ncbi:type II toxin-antitoxin system HicB family antitoxin [Candidatus Gracilibacteria bacterium]|nr:type II toxin-antitoxin system HicB family antitoxin [Candidatus Gracilibacteria bacterium]
MALVKKLPINYRIKIESCEEGGYFAFSPDLPGCQIQAETYLEALREIHAVVEAYIEDCIAAGDEIPYSNQNLVAV